MAAHAAYFFHHGRYLGMGLACLGMAIHALLDIGGMGIMAVGAIPGTIYLRPFTGIIEMGAAAHDDFMVSR